MGVKSAFMSKIFWLRYSYWMQQVVFKGVGAVFPWFKFTFRQLFCRCNFGGQADAIEHNIAADNRRWAGDGRLTPNFTLQLKYPETVDR